MRKFEKNSENGGSADKNAQFLYNLLGIMVRNASVALGRRGRFKLWRFAPRVSQILSKMAFRNYAQRKSHKKCGNKGRNAQFFEMIFQGVTRKTDAPKGRTTKILRINSKDRHKKVAKLRKIRGGESAQFFNRSSATSVAFGRNVSPTSAVSSWEMQKNYENRNRGKKVTRSAEIITKNRDKCGNLGKMLRSLKIGCRQGSNQVPSVFEPTPLTERNECVGVLTDIVYELGNNSARKKIKKISAVTDFP